MTYSPEKESAHEISRLKKKTKKKKPHHNLIVNLAGKHHISFRNQIRGSEESYKINNGYEGDSGY